MVESGGIDVSGDDAPVRSVLLPLNRDAVVLPSTMLAEVLTWGNLQTVEGAPEWLLGSISWRGRNVPVVSLECAAGQVEDGDDLQKRKLAVVYSLSAQPQLRCYALVCQNVPRPVLASSLSLRPSAGAGAVARAFLAQAVRLDGEPVYIPDIDALEASLLAGADDWLAFAADQQPDRELPRVEPTA